MTARSTQKTREEAEEALVASDVSTELAAMQRIAMALGDVRDVRIRLRVMRWAMERFLMTGAAQATTAAAPQPAASVATGARADATLDVDDLHDLFVNDTVDADDDDCTEPAAAQPADEPIESMLKSFVTDFQRIAAACLVA